MNGPDKNEDIIFYAAFAVIAVFAVIGLIVLLSGHGVIPPDPPTHQATTASPTP